MPFPRLRKSRPSTRRHLDELSDRVGIFQFADGRRPDPTHGYCTDDVARALRVDLRHAATGSGPDHRCCDPPRARVSPSRIQPGDRQVPELPGERRALARMDRLGGRPWPRRPGARRGDRPQPRSSGRGRCAHGCSSQRCRQPSSLSMRGPGHMRSWAAPRPSKTSHPRPTPSRPSRPSPSGWPAPWSGQRAADPAWPWPETPVTYDNGIVPEALDRRRRPARAARAGRPRDVGPRLAARSPRRGPTAGSDRSAIAVGGRTAAVPRHGTSSPIEPASLVFAAAAALEATGEARWATGGDAGLPLVPRRKRRRGRPRRPGPRRLPGRPRGGRGEPERGRRVDPGLAPLRRADRRAPSGAVGEPPTIRLGAGPDVRDDIGQPRGRDGDARVRGAVVDPELVRRRVVDPAAREDDTRDIAGLLVRLDWPHDPPVAPVEDDPWILEVEEGEADPVDRAARRVVDAVVEDEPALGRLERRRPEADLPGVPPRPLAGVQEERVVAPVAEVGRVRDPDVGRAGDAASGGG